MFNVLLWDCCKICFECHLLFVPPGAHPSLSGSRGHSKPGWGSSSTAGMRIFKHVHALVSTTKPCDSHFAQCLVSPRKEVAESGSSKRDAASGHSQLCDPGIPPFPIPAHLAICRYLVPRQGKLVAICAERSLTVSLLGGGARMAFGDSERTGAGSLAVFSALQGMVVSAVWLTVVGRGHFAFSARQHLSLLFSPPPQLHASLWLCPLIRRAQTFVLCSQAPFCRKAFQLCSTIA